MIISNLRWFQLFFGNLFLAVSISDENINANDTVDGQHSCEDWPAGVLEPSYVQHVLQIVVDEVKRAEWKSKH